MNMADAMITSVSVIRPLGVSGYALVAVICGLIVLEELGIPMLFAPSETGDLGQVGAVGLGAQGARSSAAR